MPRRLGREHEEGLSASQEVGLQLRKRTPKRRAKAKRREDPAPAIRPNHLWVIDFVHDQLATGQNRRILTVVDTFSRLLVLVDRWFSYRGEGVVATLHGEWRKIGCSMTIRVDNGIEFISRDMDL